MHKRHFLLSAVVPVLLLVAAPVSAQSTGQSSPSTLQQQQAGAQATGTPQSDTAPVQTNQSTEALSQYQLPSLGVVSNPNQSQPSVSVGPSNSTSELSSGTLDKTNESVLIVLLVLILLAFIVARRYKSTQEPKVALKVSTTAPPQTIKAPAPKTKKKKKKTTHR